MNRRYEYRFIPVKPSGPTEQYQDLYNQHGKDGFRILEAKSGTDIGGHENTTLIFERASTPWWALFFGGRV